ncbi:DUF3800 domain-containing protein [Thermophilibacter sp. ET337]|uniref:DUF3800 domain-containing protein n=1 Tax=Thermophilibacter sp. ET337 TaxID=2973084 RepID=UPI0021AD35A4|nr:DUF3800 domain-containing protein [Thermophilibacter sp. ET337]MCR8907600.1 DUF3800 domain-containing protein [Thermophilibacter sp. ET337]
MSDLSLFLDESGSDNLRDTCYILALVVHDQADALADNIVRYELALREKGLPDVPLHATPLLSGHDAYEEMDLAERKRLLSAFRVFFRHLPVRYGLIVLRTREYSTLADVEAAMRRKIVDFLFDNLVYFQAFDSVKIYYDDGQQSIAAALHKAIDYALSKNAVTCRPASAADYRLSQAADYICAAELTALKYEGKASTATDEKFFGSWSQFKKGMLKEVRAKRI